MKKIIELFIVTTVIMIDVVFALDKPAVIWDSQPVNPGEAVMVFGGPWSSNAVVELDDKKTIEPLCVTDDCITFVYPDKWSLSQFSAKIIDDSGSVTTLINEPDVWWMQGNEGKSATSGGWLRVFGRSIGYNDKAVVEIKNQNTSMKLSPKEFDLFGMMVEIPKSIAPGDYDVFVQNGLNGTAISAGKIEVAEYKEHWKSKIFNVVDYGAVPNDRNDDSKAISAALADLKANGGGILYFPRGRFGMQGKIDLPPYSLLKGDGMEMSQIYWLDNDYPSDALIAGKCDFGIKDICLVSGNFYKGIEVIEPEAGYTWQNKNITISNVRTRFLHTDVSKKESARRLKQTAQVAIIKGKNVKITGCDFVFTKGVFGIRGEYLYIADNRFRGPGDNQSLWFFGRQSVVSGNNMESCSSTMVNSSRNFCLKDNVFGQIYGNGDRETFTFDGGKPNFKGTAIAIDRQMVEFKKPMVWRDGPEEWLGRSIAVIGGKGAGQHRFITRIDDNKITIDRPWDILPDLDSYFGIAYGRNKLLFLDNYVSDGNPFQLYGYATDVVLSGNIAARCSGIQSYGMTKGGFPEPNWFVQFLDNRIEEGNAIRGPWSFMVPAADSRLGFFDRGMHSCGVVYPLARCGVMRRNILDNNSHILCGPKVENMLVENNVVKNSDVGLNVKSKGAVIRGNEFENVKKPYVVSDYVVMSPSEKFAADLQSVAVVNGGVPSQWHKYIKQAKSIADKDLLKVEQNRKISDLRKKAVKDFYYYVGDGIVDADVVKLLLGVDLSQNSTHQFSRLKPGKNSVVRLGNGIYPANSIPAELSAVVRPFENWQIDPFPKIKLEPGKRVSYGLNIKRAPGEMPVFSLPVEYTVEGDGWAFRFKELYENSTLHVTEFLVAGPFANTSGDQIDSNVHPPEMDVNVDAVYDTMDGKQPWKTLRGQPKKIFLNDVMTHTDTATAIAVAVIKANKSVLANVTWGKPSENLLIVNGDRVGSSARRVGIRPVLLKKGDNVFMIISSHKSGKWPLQLQLTLLDQVKPADLKILSAKEMRESSLLKPSDASEKTDEKHWKLVVSDNFNRTRLGNHWIHDSSAPGYKSVGLNIIDGSLGFYGAGGTISYFKAVNEPVKIEFDVLMENPRAQFGVLFGKRGRAIAMLDDNRRFGYMYAALGLGHKALMRNSEVVLDHKSGIYPGAAAAVWHHVKFIFDKPKCLFYFNGVLKGSYEDSQWIDGLNEISIYGGVDVQFDNIKLYVEKTK